MSDPIQPPVARRPEEALELVSQALSDGDLEAALAQYDKTALLAYWPRAAAHDGDLRQVLTVFMALRLPLAVRIVVVLESPELALVVCERRVAGADPRGEPVRLTGHGCVLVRPQPDASWRIAADVWHVGPELPPDPPEVPPAPGREAVWREGQGGPPHSC
jgi:ketosteroid isomerase-like protein